MLIEVNNVRSYKWDDSILPLCNNRHPFSSLSDQTIQNFIDYVLRFPESLGRMSRAIRSIGNIHQSCPNEFVIKESHIDINEVSPHLKSVLMSLGFEQDNFLTLNPPEYLFCYTMRMECEFSNPSRLKTIDEYIKSSMERAIKEISNMPGIFAYSEIETYTHKNCLRIPFVDVSHEGINNFPFKSNHFVPNKDAVIKKADIHVKVPLRIKGPDFIKSESTLMLQLRQLFLSAGFYEIRSLSGNCIYTLQMDDVSLAKDCYKSIAKWAKNHGGIYFVSLEMVTDFWRKEETIGNNQFKSPIPNIVKLNRTN